MPHDVRSSGSTHLSDGDGDAVTATDRANNSTCEHEDENESPAEESDQTPGARPQSSREVIVCLNNIGVVLINAGDEENYPEALSNLLECTNNLTEKVQSSLGTGHVNTAYQGNDATQPRDNSSPSESIPAIPRPFGVIRRSSSSMSASSLPTSRASLWRGEVGEREQNLKCYLAELEAAQDQIEREEWLRLIGNDISGYPESRNFSDSNRVLYNPPITFRGRLFCMFPHVTGPEQDICYSTAIPIRLFRPTNADANVISSVILTTPQQSRLPPQTRTLEQQVYCEYDGCDEFDSAIALYNTAILYYKAGGIDGARCVFNLASSVASMEFKRTERSGPVNRMNLFNIALLPLISAQAMNNLGRMNAQEGLFIDALKCFETGLSRAMWALRYCQCLERDASALHRPASDSEDLDEHQWTVQAARCVGMMLNDIALHHYLSGHYEKAMQQCHDAMRLLRPFLPRMKVASTSNSQQRGLECDIATLLYNSSMIQRKMGGIDGVGSIGMYEHIGRSKFGLSPCVCARLLRDIGIFIHIERGNSKDAITHLLQSMRLRRAILCGSLDGENEPSPENFGNVVDTESAKTLRAIGSILHDIEDYSEAVEIFKHALKSEPQFPGGGGMSTAYTLRSLGDTYHTTGNLALAIDFYTRCLHHCRAVIDTGGLGAQEVNSASAFIATLQNSIAVLHLECGYIRGAMENFTSAWRMYLLLGVRFDTALNMPTGTFHVFGFNHQWSAAMA